jgi:hypothetical protein
MYVATQCGSFTSGHLAKQTIWFGQVTVTIPVMGPSRRLTRDREVEKMISTSDLLKFLEQSRRKLHRIDSRIRTAGHPLTQICLFLRSFRAL